MRVGNLFIMLVIALAITGFVYAQAQSLEEELAQLEQDLVDSGYSWLVDYNESDLYSSVEVYEENSDELLMSFEVSVDKEYKKFLTALPDNYTQDVFDLKVVCGGTSEQNASDCGVEFDYVVDPEISPVTEIGLVALYHFNNDSSVGENDTLVYDFADGNLNNGTWIGNDSAGAFRSGVDSSGLLGGSFNFDGEGDYITGGAVVSDYPYTLLAWTNTSLSTFQSIVFVGQDSDADRYSVIQVSSSGFFGLDSRYDSGLDEIDSTVAPDGAWHHVVGVFTDATTRELYVDAVNYVNDSTSHIFPLVNSFDIGRFGDSTPVASMNGSIDEVAIYNRSLNATEILTLYNIGIGNVTNVWNCTTLQGFDNSGCWSLGRVPQNYDDVVFNGTGIGDVNITNNTMPQYLNSFTVGGNYSGTIHFMPMFAVGSWGSNALGSQEWNVTGDINISNGTMKVYGDYLLNPAGNYNDTEEGHGQIWRSLSGNITVGAGVVIDGIGLGFASGFGPGKGSTTWYGGTHGGRGGSQIATSEGSKNIYGNATAPTSLGSGGTGNPGGSGIKLYAVDLVQIDGTIDMRGVDLTSNVGAGGSIWLIADNISGAGVINSQGGANDQRGGGGGRIRLEYGSALNFIGTINVGGGASTGGYLGGYGGTLTFTNNTWPGDMNLTADIGLLGGDYEASYY